MDVTRLSEMGWKYTIPLKEGLKKAYEFFQKETEPVRS
jgi:nucleoside-diphosphate-sugar epimerase